MGERRNEDGKSSDQNGKMGRRTYREINFHYITMNYMYTRFRPLAIMLSDYFTIGGN